MEMRVAVTGRDHFAENLERIAPATALRRHDPPRELRKPRFVAEAGGVLPRSEARFHRTRRSIAWSARPCPRAAAFQSMCRCDSPGTSSAEAGEILALRMNSAPPECGRRRAARQRARSLRSGINPARLAERHHLPCGEKAERIKDWTRRATAPGNGRAAGLPAKAPRATSCRSADFGKRDRFAASGGLIRMAACVAPLAASTPRRTRWLSPAKTGAIGPHEMRSPRRLARVCRMETSATLARTKQSRYAAPLFWLAPAYHIATSSATRPTVLRFGTTRARPVTPSDDGVPPVMGPARFVKDSARAHARFAR